MPQDKPKITLHRMFDPIANPVYDRRYSIGVHARPTFGPGAAYLLHTDEFGGQSIEWIPSGDRFEADAHPTFFRAVQAKSDTTYPLDFNELMAIETGSTLPAQYMGRQVLDRIVKFGLISERQFSTLITELITEPETAPA